MNIQLVLLFLALFFAVVAIVCGVLFAIAKYPGHKSLMRALVGLAMGLANGLIFLAQVSTRFTFSSISNLVIFFFGLIIVWFELKNINLQYSLKEKLRNFLSDQLPDWI